MPLDRCVGERRGNPAGANGLDPLWFRKIALKHPRSPGTVALSDHDLRERRYRPDLPSGFSYRLAVASGSPRTNICGFRPVPRRQARASRSSLRITGIADESGELLDRSITASPRTPTTRRPACTRGYSMPAGPTQPASARYILGNGRLPKLDNAVFY